ncbi:unnamed protein product, partial [Scytosiphon promiscuus]
MHDDGKGGEGGHLSFGDGSLLIIFSFSLRVCRFFFSPRRRDRTHGGESIAGAGGGGLITLFVVGVRGCCCFCASADLCGSGVMSLVPSRPARRRRKARAKMCVRTGDGLPGRRASWIFTDAMKKCVFVIFPVWPRESTP